MPRKAMPAHKRRDKLSNGLDSKTRAQGQLADFLAARAIRRGVTRGALIERLCESWARRNGYKPKG